MVQIPMHQTTKPQLLEVALQEFFTNYLAKLGILEKILIAQSLKVPLQEVFTKFLANLPTSRHLLAFIMWCLRRCVQSSFAKC
jgi:hypothetical protein